MNLSNQQGSQEPDSQQILQQAETLGRDSMSNIEQVQRFDTSRVKEWSSTTVVQYLQQELPDNINIDHNKWSIINGQILDIVDIQDLEDLGIQSLDHRCLIINTIYSLLNKQNKDDCDLINAHLEHEQEQSNTLRKITNKNWSQDKKKQLDPYDKFILQKFNCKPLVALQKDMIYGSSIVVIIEFLEMRQVSKLRQLNIYFRDHVIKKHSIYTKRRSLKKSKDESMQKSRVGMLFEYSDYYFQLNKKTLTWQKGKKLYRRDHITNQDVPFTFNFNWPKSCQLEDSSKMIFTGGIRCKRNLPPNIENQAPTDETKDFSKETYILDLDTGRIERKADMIIKRQGHGIVRVGNKVYCAGGLDGTVVINQSLEIYDIQRDVWDFGPEMSMRKFSMTLVNIRDRYIYSFGGMSPDIQQLTHCLEIEKLDTQRQDVASFQWERIIVKNIKIFKCGQQAIIPLKPHNQDIDRFLIFGGVQSRNLKQSHIIEINTTLSLQNKDCIQIKKCGQLFQYIEDKFYNTATIRLNKLPSWLQKFFPDRQIQKNYSENLLCFHGRFSIVVIDLDNEKTLFQSKSDRFAYEWTFQQIQSKKKSNIDEHPYMSDVLENESNPFEDRQMRMTDVFRNQLVNPNTFSKFK